MSQEHPSSRRSFIRSLGRLLLAGALTGSVGALIARPGDACEKVGVCSGCPALGDCRLPQAESAREPRGR